jgi:hypothetical protein
MKQFAEGGLCTEQILAFSYPISLLDFGTIRPPLLLQFHLTYYEFSERLAFSYPVFLLSSISGRKTLAVAVPSIKPLIKNI